MKSRIDVLVDKEIPTKEEINELIGLLEDKQKKEGKLKPEYQGLLNTALVIRGDLKLTKDGELVENKDPVEEKPSPGSERENSVSDIIKREKFIVQNLKFQVEKGYSQCKSCDESAIKYHEDIIYYLEGLL